MFSGSRTIRYALAPFAALALVLLSLGSFGVSSAFASEESPSPETTTTSGTTATSAPEPEGDLSVPQPTSNADAQDGGANGDCPDGPYCSTRDGSASQNGSGDGKATGRPCAGCVGKADNKNPPGQMPDGTDPNAGYECDTNQGLGQGNPAHTSCTASVDADQEGTAPSSDTPQILGVEASADPASRDAAANRAAPGLAPAAAVLPDTGATSRLWAMLAAGVALLLAGTTLLAARRRSGVRR